MQHEQDTLLPIVAVAKRLGVSVRTVYNLIERGQLGCVMVSDRCTRVSQADLEAYIDARRR